MDTTIRISEEEHWWSVGLEDTDHLIGIMLLLQSEHRGSTASRLHTVDIVALVRWDG